MENQLTDTPDGKLLMKVLHIAGVQPLYLRVSDGDGGPQMRLSSAIVLIDGGHWPPDPDLTEAAIEWACRVTGLDPEHVTLTGWPTFAGQSALTRLPASESFEPVPRLHRLGDDNAS